MLKLIKITDHLTIFYLNEKLEPKDYEFSYTVKII